MKKKKAGKGESESWDREGYAAGFSLWISGMLLLRMYLLERCERVSYVDEHLVDNGLRVEIFDFQFLDDGFRVIAKRLERQHIACS